MNYEEERLAIYEWYRDKARKYLETPVKREGRDSEAGAQHSKNTAEFNRRLDALDAKYGVKRNADGTVLSG